MSNCGQACPYNTLEGCKAKEYNKICPLTNTAVPITEYRPTNADRIRAMTDEELAKALEDECSGRESCYGCFAYRDDGNCPGESKRAWMEWLQQPAEGD